MPLGRRVTVQVPATSANLGPGFDSFGLALGWYDSITLEVTETGFTAAVTGEGAEGLPRDERHLVLSSALAALAALDVHPSGLHLSCANTIPHGRGLGSSSAAIVSGLLGAATLAGQRVDRQWLLQVADRIEGHPDNVAAAIFGGMVVAYAAADELRVAEIAVHPAIEALVLVPDTPVATRTARGMLPAQVSHTDAAANSARAALLVSALASNPDLLFDGTEDRLHQSYRSGVMTDSYALLRSLRQKGFAAVISGAGPSLLVLGTGADLDRVEVPARCGFRAHRLTVGAGARVVEP